MAEQTYRIRELEWRRDSNGEHYVHAITGETYWIFAKSKAGWYEAGCGSMRAVNRRTLEAAKAACSAHYRARIREALIPVEVESE